MRRNYRMSLNKVLFIGNITKDIELKYIPSGKAVAKFGVALNNKYKDSTGEYVEKVTFVNIVAWEKKAESASKYLSKGSKVFIEGRVDNRSWETDSGEKRYATEYIADWIEFLDSKKDSKPEPANDEPGPDKQTGIPF